jgi:hypothetical protein
LEICPPGTSLDSEILTLGLLYRDRADSENVFDDLKNQWGWRCFTTQDPTRCRLLAGTVSAGLQLVKPVRPLGRSRTSSRSDHQSASPAVRHRTPNSAAGQMTLTVSSTHGMHDKAGSAYLRPSGFLAELRKNAEQLDPLEKWYRILSEALRHFLHGRQLQPPLRLYPT